MVLKTSWNLATSWGFSVRPISSSCFGSIWHHKQCHKHCFNQKRQCTRINWKKPCEIQGPLQNTARFNRSVGCTPTSRAKKAWTLLVLSRQSKQLVLMVPPWVLKKEISKCKKKLPIHTPYTHYWLPTFWCRSLQNSKRSHTPRWTCWHTAWGHCAVCLFCLP